MVWSRFHQWIRRTPTSAFVSAAAITTIAGTVGLYMCHRMLQWRVRSLPHFKDALDIVAQHDIAKKFLGSPIKVGDVDLADRTNTYVSSQNSHLRIPVVGSLNAGFLNVHAARASEEEAFATERVELELENAGKYLIYGSPPLLLTEGDD